METYGSCAHTAESADSADMTVLFRDELAAIRTKLQSQQPETLGKETAGGKAEAANGKPETPTSKAVPMAFGHRAGFDAFMTGYSFGCYAVQSSSSGEGVLTGLQGMRNKLASRPGRNWTVPLHILKSHFAKTSSTHATASERLKALATQRLASKD